MAQLFESKLISGIWIAALDTHGDERGRFTEVFRKEWFPQRTWERLQWSRSESQAGVLRGLHYHRRQVDYWHCAAGHMRIGLVDLRPTSPTTGQTQTIELDQQALGAVFIPIGVAHGFYALTEVVLFYLVDNYYDGSDEFGVAWNDPALGLDWGIEGLPTLSARDCHNPGLHDIPVDQLPW